MVVVEVGVAAVAFVLVAVAVARGRWQWLVVVRWRCWSACGSCVVQCRLVVMALASPALAVMVVLVDVLVSIWLEGALAGVVKVWCWLYAPCI